jgi:alpha-ribazole phosphatase
MSLKIYFLRHGQTAHSKDNLFCGCGSNPGLTGEGREMATQFGEAYKGISWSGIYAVHLFARTRPQNRFARYSKQS